MECLQSFQIRIQQQQISAAGNGTCTTWGTVGQYFFSCNLAPNLQDSTYNFLGFKSVDIYGISMNGYVQGNFTSATKCAVVNDWSFAIFLDGFAPLSSGDKTVTPDAWNLKVVGSGLNQITLNKYSNSIMFSDPYRSVSDINFLALFAQGVGAQFLNEVALIYDVMFTFYYKYEGE